MPFDIETFREKLGNEATLNLIILAFDKLNVQYKLTVEEKIIFGLKYHLTDGDFSDRARNTDEIVIEAVNYFGINNPLGNRLTPGYIISVLDQAEQKVIESIWQNIRDIVSGTLL